MILSELLAWLIILRFISEPLNSLLFKERFVLQICSLNILLEFSRLSYCSVINVLRCRSNFYSLTYSFEFVKYFFLLFTFSAFCQKSLFSISYCCLLVKSFIFLFSNFFATFSLPAPVRRLRSAWLFSNNATYDITFFYKCQHLFSTFFKNNLPSAYLPTLVPLPLSYQKPDNMA